MDVEDAGREAGRAWWWAVLRTERDRRLAAQGGRPITAPNLRRLLLRRLNCFVEDQCERLQLSSHFGSKGAGKGGTLGSEDFHRRFLDLTGNPPLSWQTRLYLDWFAQGKFPSVIDLPTGMGKTMVMAVWLIARAELGHKIPTRLIYVVDRRTVVDQATDLAQRLVQRPTTQWMHEAFDGQPPAISTLRGQLADNREWSRDPSRPAIIIGTVDLIGSALLFSGYRSSYKRRPLEAGLLGQDSLLVLDEAHLSKPFEKLVRAINHDGQYQKDRNGVAQGKPMRVIRMSATTAGEETARFKLESADLSDSSVKQRFEATKKLAIKDAVEAKELNNSLAEAAVEIGQDVSLRGTRIVVFVRKPNDAEAIAQAIRDHEVKIEDLSGSKPRTVKTTPYSDSVEVLTGTMRGLERDELLTKYVLRRFLDGNESPFECPNQRPVFLISTSAGEVGFDLNADHMVSDATTTDSLIQRLGRVNRRGLGDATVLLLHEPPKKDKQGEIVKPKGLDLAIANALKLFDREADVSPKDIANFKRTTWAEIPESEKGNDKPKSLFELACSPEIPTVDLTDILLGAWSMTSIREPMPGRPPVDPWLRGIAEWEPPRTEISWRTELGIDGFADLDIGDVEEWFDTHRILTHETLSVKTSDTATWFQERWKALPEERQRDLAKRPVIIDRAGMEVVPLGEVIARLSRKSADSDAFLCGAEIVVPSSFGGIRRGIGLLDSTEPKLDKDEEKKPLDEQEIILATRQNLIDVADIAPVRTRQRKIEIWTEEGQAEPTILGNGKKPARSSRFHVDLESDDGGTVRLVSYVPRFERPEAGSKEQPLEQHVCAVRKHADATIAALELRNDDPARLALELAADWHDHGKNREFFQRAVHGKPSPGGRPWPIQTLGKSGGKDFGKAPRGYRHEFGSLREFIDAFNAGKLLDHAGKPTSREVFDLAMHLIAVHHGRGRPHFPKGGFDPDCESRSDEIHTESIRRFARLQRTYGWWHLAWLENLLRCADALASADAESEGDPGDTDGAES